MNDTNFNTNPGYNPNVQNSRPIPPPALSGKPAGKVENKEEVGNRRISDVAQSKIPSQPDTPPTKKMRITNPHESNPQKYTPTPYQDPAKEAERPRVRSTPGAAYIPPSGKKLQPLKPGLEPLKPGSVNPNPAAAEVQTTKQKNAPLPRPAISSEQESKIKEFNTQEINLISGAEPSLNADTLKEIRNERHKILKSMVETIKDTRANPSQEQVDSALANEVEGKLYTLEETNEGDELNNLVADLKTSFALKRDSLSPAELKTYEEAIKAIHSAFQHKRQVDELMNPKQVAAGKAARIKTFQERAATKNAEDVKTKSNALQKILDTYGKLKPGSKIGINNKTKEFEIKKRKFDPLSKFRTSKEGTSQEAVRTYFSILNKMSFLQNNTPPISSNEDLKNQAKEIIAKLETDTRFKAACGSDRQLQGSFDAIKKELEKKEPPERRRSGD